MTEPQRPETRDSLFLRVMHLFAQRFDQHAILKGGMALRLLDSPRSTTDIDYVFVPFASKREIVDEVEAALGQLEEAEVELVLHSKMMRATVQVGEARIQVEINVALECAAVPMTTGAFARAQGQPSQVVAVMSFDTALAEKLAAWNERRLLRDLYDCYFLAERLGAGIDLAVLDRRLSKVESRLPAFRTRKRMTRAELGHELAAFAKQLTEEAVRGELGPVLPPEELAGLVPRLRASASRLVDDLAPAGS
jgi:predicted nucleotidyltransferase component of viral defense system